MTQIRYTNETAVEQIVQHLTAQKKQSRREGAGCQYRAPDGCMCAVGVLIPEDQYKVELEGRRAISLINLVPAISDVDPLLLEAFQCYHDSAFISKGEEFVYGRWLRGSEAHHPEKAAEAIKQYVARLRK